MQDRVIFVQGGIEPIFKGDIDTVGEDILCENCQNLLAENCDLDSLIGVGLRCCQCEGVFWTSSLPVGEIFSSRILNVGDEEFVLLKSTVQIPRGESISSNAEIIRMLSNIAPKTPEVALELTAAGIAILEDVYSKLKSRDILEKQKKKIARTKGNEKCAVFPFAWAIREVNSCLESNEFDLDRHETLQSLAHLDFFRRVNDAWSEHPRYLEVAKKMTDPDGFFHTLAVLIQAYYLYQEKFVVGLSLENDEGQPNPDLYIKDCSGVRKFHIEVKAPTNIQYNGTDGIHLDRAIKSIQDTIKRSRKQIRRGFPGALTIYSSLIEVQDLMSDIIDQELKMVGNAHKNLHSVTFMCLGLPVRNDRELSFPFHYRQINNPYWSPS